MKNKHLIKIFILLVFIATTSAAYLLLPEKSLAPVSKPLTQNILWQNVTTDTIINNENNQRKNNAPAIIEYNTTTLQSLTQTTITQTKNIANNPISTTIEINGEKYNLNLHEKSTAYDAMKNLAAEKKISWQTKEFSGLGYFVEEINGIKNDNQTGKYWIYYINGKSAQIGISSYILKTNDLITWKYEKAQF